MKRWIATIMLTLTAANAEVRITDVSVSVEEDYNIFFMTVQGTEVDAIYIFQISTDLRTWIDDLEDAFLGTGEDIEFFDLVPRTQKSIYYRIKKVGHI